MSLNSAQTALRDAFTEFVCNTFQFGEDQRPQIVDMVNEGTTPLILKNWPAPTVSLPSKTTRTKGPLNAYQLFMRSISAAVRDEQTEADAQVTSGEMTKDERDSYVGPMQVTINANGGTLFKYASLRWKEIKGTDDAAPYVDEAQRLRQEAGKAPIKSTGSGKRPQNAYNYFTKFLTRVRKGEESVDDETKAHFDEVFDSANSIQSGQSTLWKEMKENGGDKPFVQQADEAKAAFLAEKGEVATA